MEQNNQNDSYLEICVNHLPRRHNWLVSLNEVYNVSVSILVCSSGYKTGMVMHVQPPAPNSNNFSGSY